MIADRVNERRDVVKLVLVAGPSSSGKTTFSKKLAIHLRVLGRNPVLISQDDYFVPREVTPRDEEGNYDFEALEAIDVELLNEQLLAAHRRGGGRDPALRLPHRRAPAGRAAAAPAGPGGDHPGGHPLPERRADPADPRRDEVQDLRVGADPAQPRRPQPHLHHGQPPPAPHRARLPVPRARRAGHPGHVAVGAQRRGPRTSSPSRTRSTRPSTRRWTTSWRC